MIRSVKDYNFKNKRTLLRVDFNVPLSEDNKITDDIRIVSTLPTIKKIMDDGGIPIIMSHLGRPKGEKNLKYSLKPVADYLNDLFPNKLKFATDCIGNDTVALTKSAVQNEIVLLENLRFYPQEEKNDPDFSSALAKNGDVYVNDAFGTAHRSHSSVDGLARLFNDKFSGFLMQKEIEYLANAIENPKRPFVAIIGGSKISGKIDVITNLLDKCDSVLIGGGMTYTFFKAMGLNIGTSLLEADKINLARDIINRVMSGKNNLFFPIDYKVADKFDNDANTQIVGYKEFPDDWMGMDVGPATLSMYAEIIEKANTIIWNGPVGVFEFSNFDAGTKKIAMSLVKATERGATTIIGGGDSAAAINKFGLADKISHISTGGGASLELLEGKKLPGVEALEN